MIGALDERLILRSNNLSKFLACIMLGSAMVFIVSWRKVTELAHIA